MARSIRHETPYGADRGAPPAARRPPLGFGMARPSARRRLLEGPRRRRDRGRDQPIPHVPSGDVFDRLMAWSRRRRGPKIFSRDMRIPAAEWDDLLRFTDELRIIFGPQAQEWQRDTYTIDREPDGTVVVTFRRPDDAADGAG